LELVLVWIDPKSFKNFAETCASKKGCLTNVLQHALMVLHGYFSFFSFFCKLGISGQPLHVTNAFGETLLVHLEGTSC
jgi:hypothetical protein